MINLREEVDTNFIVSYTSKCVKRVLGSVLPRVPHHTCYFVRLHHFSETTLKNTTLFPDSQPTPLKTNGAY
jgi:hypothetical protein